MQHQEHCFMEAPGGGKCRNMCEQYERHSTVTHKPAPTPPPPPFKLPLELTLMEAGSHKKHGTGHQLYFMGTNQPSWNTPCTLPLFVSCIHHNAITPPILSAVLIQQLCPPHAPHTILNAGNKCTQS